MFSKPPISLLFFASLLFCAIIPRANLRAEIVVLIPPQKFIVEAIVKETATVKALLPTTQSLEHFSPSPNHLRAIESAKLYLALAHPAISVEPQLILKIAKEAKIESASMSEKLKLKDYDPHYWLSLSNIEPIVEAILPALAKLHPEHEQSYRKNGAELIAEAKKLKSELSILLEPIKGRAFLVFHPSWQYFAEDLGLKELAIEQHGREPSPAALQEIINQAKAEKISCVFQEPQLSSSAVNAVAEMIGAKIGQLNPLGEDLFANVSEAANKILTATRDGSCS